MTEADWLESRDPQAMLAFLRNAGISNERKLCLWACACVRRVWILLPDGRSRNGIEVRERYEDGEVAEAEMRSADEAARLARAEARDIYRFAENADDTSPEVAPAWAAGAAAAATSGNPHGQDMSARAIACMGPGVWQRAYERERTAQARLLGHIFGSPFRSLAFPAHWSSTVVRLAESLYAGEACAFALHDALLEEGHAELAEHFQQEECHPKGCFALDLILGRSP